MSPEANPPPAPVMLESSCPRCGHAMLLPLPSDCDLADAQRLSRLIICDSCAGQPKPEQEPPKARLPYKDL